jgi:hypothetical protein
MNPPSPPMQDACDVSPLPLPRSLSWQDLLGAFLMILRGREYSNNNNNNNTCPPATISPIGRKKWYNLSNWLEEQLLMHAVCTKYFIRVDMQVIFKVFRRDLWIHHKGSGRL